MCIDWFGIALLNLPCRACFSALCILFWVTAKSLLLDDGVLFVENSLDEESSNPPFSLEVPLELVLRRDRVTICNPTGRNLTLRISEIQKAFFGFVRWFSCTIVDFAVWEHNGEETETLTGRSRTFRISEIWNGFSVFCRTISSFSTLFLFDFETLSIIAVELTSSYDLFLNLTVCDS